MMSTSLNKAQQKVHGIDEDQRIGPLQLDFTPLPLAEWRDLFLQIPRSTLLQSYDYAVAVRQVDFQNPIWAVILIDNQIAGLMQGFETGLFGRAIHTIAIDRGPLWLPGFGTDGQISAFWQTINDSYPSRIGRRRRFIPESRTDMQLPGLCQQQHVKPYQTARVDLKPDIAELRANLRGNWRGHLHQAEHEAGLNVHFDERGAMTEWLLRVYGDDRRQRGYRGTNLKLTRALIESFAKGDGMAIGWAEYHGDPVAVLLLLCHGQCATWQVGWVGPQGRDLQANYKLVWESLLYLKNRGITALDLGGMNDEDAKGIRDFKAGLHGEHITLCGQFA